MFHKSVRLLYFSPTGTTRKVLEAISEGLGEDKPNHINLTSAKAKIGGTRKIKGGLTIIGVPVYTGRVALEAVRRIQRLKAKDAPAVIVVVYGNREYEDALLELKDIVVEAGFTPIAGATFIGEHSFSTESTLVAHGRPDNDDLNRAKLFGALVKENTTKSRKNEGISNLHVPGNFPYRERGPVRNISPETDDSICVRCEMCKEVCPTDAILLLNGFVKSDAHKCILCCACVKSCPSVARRLNDHQLVQFIKKLSISCSRRKEPEFFF